jgi:hypothetical protein
LIRIVEYARFQQHLKQEALNIVIRLEAIFHGDKRFEFRRTVFRIAVEVVVVYTTSPVCMESSM